MLKSVAVLLSLVGLFPMMVYTQPEVFPNQRYLNVVIPEIGKPIVYFVNDSSGVFVINQSDKAVTLKVGKRDILSIGKNQVVKQTSVFRKKGGKRTWSIVIGNNFNLSDPKYNMAFWKKQKIYLDGKQIYPATEVDNDYIVNYNKANGQVKYYAQGKAVAARKFRPRVDQSLIIRVNGYNPYRDSLEIEKKEFDLHLEQKTDFEKLFGGEGDQTGQEEETSLNKKAQTKIDTTGVTGLKQQLVEMNRTVGLLYDSLYRTTLSSEQSLDDLIVELEKSIRSVFPGLSSAQPNNLERYVRGKIAEIPEQEREEAKEIFDRGLATYRKLTGYHKIGTYSTKVADKDVLDLSLQWYRDGRKVADPFALRFHNKGELKVDFSTGIMGHFLIDDAFTTRVETSFDSTQVMVNGESMLQIDTTKKARILQKRGEQINWSIPVLAHCYWRNGGVLNASITAGALIDKDGDDATIRPLVGGSILIGRNQRIVLSGGVVIGSVQRLATGLEAGEKGTLLDLNDGETLTVDTERVTKVSGFISLTYNLGKK